MANGSVCVRELPVCAGYTDNNERSLIMSKIKLPKWWEMLAVLVIIFVVAAVLFPVFAPAREHDIHYSCLSGIKQLGLSISQYVSDYDNTMPNISDAPGSKNTWRNMVYPDIKNKQFYKCPQDPITTPGPDGYFDSFAANYSGNGRGGKFDKGLGAFAGPGSEPVALSDMAEPQYLIVLCEVDNNNRPDFNINHLPSAEKDAPRLSVRHAGGSNYLFADSHSKWFRPDVTKYVAPFDANLWYRNPHRPLSPVGVATLKDAGTHG